MNEADDVPVRRQVAAEHGLNWPEAKFLVGETIEELSASATKLARLLGKQHEQEQERPPGFFDRVAAEKDERKGALAAILTGRAPQPRDEHGRFATSFDGGARQPAPLPPPSHDAWLVNVIRDRRADSGARI